MGSGVRFMMACACGQGKQNGNQRAANQGREESHKYNVHHAHSS